MSNATTRPAMRVLHVIYSLEASTGGPPKVALALAATQAQMGAQTAILSYAPPQGDRARRTAYGHLPGFDKVEWIILPTPSLGERLFASKALKQIAAFAPDVLHLHGTWEPLLRQAGRWAEHQDKPYAMTTHSMLDPWHQKRYRLVKWTLFHLLGWKALMRHAHFQQALTSFERDYIQALGFGCRIEVVPNGIFPDEIRAHSIRPAVELFPFLQGRPFLFFAARLHPQKGADVLLEAFARIAKERPDLCLILAGAEYGQGATLRDRVQQVGLEDRVFFPGLLSPADMGSALAAATVFCLPSRAEGFSLALLEAALAGTPLLISPGCHFDELAEVGAAKLVPLEPQAIASALLQIASDPTARETMGSAGQVHVQKKYTWEAIAQKLLQLYTTESVYGG